MSKLSKVFAILTIVSSVIGIVIIVIYWGSSRSTDQKLLVLCFGLTLTVIPYCIARSISELNHLSNLKLSHKD